MPAGAWPTSWSRWTPRPTARRSPSSAGCTATSSKASLPREPSLGRTTALVAGRVRSSRSPTRWRSPRGRARRRPTGATSPAASPAGRGIDTERIADVLDGQVIAGCDLLIDLHSAGVAYAMPVFVGCAGGDDQVSQRSVAAATAFGAPLGWVHAVMNPGRSLSAARISASPGSTSRGRRRRAARAEVPTYVEGVLNVLAGYGSVAPRAARPPTRRWMTGGDGDVDASLGTSTRDGASPRSTPATRSRKAI